MLFATWGGTAVSAVAFVLVERRTAEPIIPLHLFKDLNANLSTFAGLLIGVAMFGAIGYLPTYLQMAFSVIATESGLLKIPMMRALRSIRPTGQQDRPVQVDAHRGIPASGEHSRVPWL